MKKVIYWTVMVVACVVGKTASEMYGPKSLAGSALFLAVWGGIWFLHNDLEQRKKKKAQAEEGKPPELGGAPSSVEPVGWTVVKVGGVIVAMIVAVVLLVVLPKESPAPTYNYTGNYAAQEAFQSPPAMPTKAVVSEVVSLEPNRKEYKVTTHQADHHIAFVMPPKWGCLPPDATVPNRLVGLSMRGGSDNVFIFMTAMDIGTPYNVWEMNREETIKGYLKKQPKSNPLLSEFDRILLCGNRAVHSSSELTESNLRIRSENYVTCPGHLMLSVNFQVWGKTREADMKSASDDFQTFLKSLVIDGTPNGNPDKTLLSSIATKGKALPEPNQPERKPRERVLTIKSGTREHRIGLTIPEGWTTIREGNSSGQLLFCTTANAQPSMDFGVFVTEVTPGQASAFKDMSPEEYFERFTTKRKSITVQSSVDTRVAGKIGKYAFIRDTDPTPATGELRMFCWGYWLVTLEFMVRDTDLKAFDRYSKVFEKITESIWLDEKPAPSVSAVPQPAPER
jgi:hypothetical protein